MRQPAKITIEDINSLGPGQFATLLGGVFENSPWVAEEAWSRRPFSSVEELHGAMCAVVQLAGVERQEKLINAHPDLVGSAARLGTLTPESAREQSSAGLDRLSAEEISQFEKLNKAYRDKFGFPFVICVRENKKDAVIEGFSYRISNSREDEVERALEEIAKIARLRLMELIEG